MQGPRLYRSKRVVIDVQVDDYLEALGNRSCRPRWLHSRKPLVPRSKLVLVQSSILGPVLGSIRALGSIRVLARDSTSVLECSRSELALGSK